MVGEAGSRVGLMTEVQARRVFVEGTVQGVGFRPFVYSLATRHGLGGRVRNTAQGVEIEAEGLVPALEAFLERLRAEAPPLARIHRITTEDGKPLGLATFEIVGSQDGEGFQPVAPDVATCRDCLRELFDTGDRRYLYPFTNCTHCGPRYSIIEAVPYDRANTSMKAFSMCDLCRQEYEDPLDRRFHAQPTACAVCGPHLELWDPAGRTLSSHNDALRDASEALRAGGIVALKGLGGFQLMVDATNEDAVARLRARKHREEKPLALLYPSLALVQEACQVSLLEQRLLLSSEAPIILLERKAGMAGATCGVAPSVAPRNPYLGIMLPYTPLHHLMMRELNRPLVATSGNLSDEPICTDELEALRRLGGIADYFLVHNRPIVRHVDDSIVRVVMGRELVLRRARGFAPLPLQLARPVPGMLAVGGHLKNTVALAAGENIFLSQHIGDLENREALNAFGHVIESFRRLYRVDPDLVVSDLHPDYASSKFAHACGKDVVSIQHHWAHIAACMAENELEGPVLGVSWDGTGYGIDGTIWGGEFLSADDNGFQRLATFKKFRLPGGDKAVKEPRRAAVGVLYEIYGRSLLHRDDLVSVRAFVKNELKVLCRMLDRGIHSPWTTSAGRLFDAVASLINLRQLVTFEGQAAMELEFALPSRAVEEAPFPYRLLVVNAPTARSVPGAQAVARRQLIVIDWEPLVRGLLAKFEEGKSIGGLTAAFHNTLIEIIVAVAKRCFMKKVVLSGGCFQNRYLTEQAVMRLRQEGFSPYWHRRVPPNDGGIALGQVAAAALLQRNGGLANAFPRLNHGEE